MRDGDTVRRVRVLARVYVKLDERKQERGLTSEEEEVYRKLEGWMPTFRAVLDALGYTI